jgi:putative membrane protein
MQTENKTISNNSIYLWIIGVLSVLIPVVVAVLFYIQRSGGGLLDLDVRFLPHLNGVINTATSAVLLVGYYFIKRGKQREHKASMLTAFALSGIFLVSYVIYHSAGRQVSFGGEGIIKWIYFLLLITHIVLAAAVVPLVLLSIYYGLTYQNQKHKKLTRWTFPIWLYVSVTGVLVYLMISPYYGN